jgi:hypothetical protein
VDLRPVEVVKIEVIKIPTEDAKIWSRGNKFVLVVKDPAVVRELKELVPPDAKVSVKIEEIELYARPVHKVNNGKEYVLFFLPKTLNPTWARLNMRESVPVVITITRRADDNVAYLKDGLKPRGETPRALGSENRGAPAPSGGQAGQDIQER